MCFCNAEKAKRHAWTVNTERATFEVYVALLNNGEDYSLDVNRFLVHILLDKHVSWSGGLYLDLY